MRRRRSTNSRGDARADPGQRQRRLGHDEGTEVGGAHRRPQRRAHGRDGGARRRWRSTTRASASSLTPPPGGFTLDALVMDGRVTPDDRIEELGLQLNRPARTTTKPASCGAVKGGGPTITRARRPAPTSSCRARMQARPREDQADRAPKVATRSRARPTAAAHRRPRCSRAPSSTCKLPCLSASARSASARLAGALAQAVREAHLAIHRTTPPHRSRRPDAPPPRQSARRLRDRRRSC